MSTITSVELHLSFEELKAIVRLVGRTSPKMRMNVGLTPEESDLLSKWWDHLNKKYALGEAL